MSSVECYNFEAKEWTSNEEMNSRRSTFRAVVFNEEIYAIGGYDGLYIPKVFQTITLMHNTIHRYITNQQSREIL